MRITLPSGTPAELVTVPDATAGLVVLPDIMGLRPLFDEQAAMLAGRTGRTVCVVEPWPGRESSSLDDRLGAVGTLRDADLRRDAREAAEATGATDVAVLGFCMGGMDALKASAFGVFNRAVACYGMIRVPEHWHGEDRGEPLAALADPDRCPVLAVIGTADVWTPPDDVDALEAAGAQVVRYEGAEHGFVHDPSRPAHRADDAADVWNRITDFLA